MNVAIIGAGLGGCALGLSLASHSIPVTLYESRPVDSPLLIQSGIILTPNGLRVLDKLGIFSRIKSRCYVSTHRTFKNDRDETIRKTLIAHESLYGYSNHRIWRTVLLDELKTMLHEHGVVIHYDSKFGGIVSDSPTMGVEFLVNSIRQRASLLVGSDGIYSAVRQYLSPDITPEYTGTVGILAHIRRSAVSWPDPNYERNATIQATPGGLFFIAEDPDAVDLMIGLQVQHPEQSREDLERLQTDKEKLLSFYRRGYEQWGKTAQQIIDAISESRETLYIWPFMRMPRFDRWYSKTGRVVIVGDAAHAVPPSSGQGFNQALEDVYTLTLVLDKAAGLVPATTSVNDEEKKPNSTNMADTRWMQALHFWQCMRQDRIDAVFDWATKATNVQRLPEAERQRLIKEGKVKPGKEGEGDNMAWLYRTDPGVELQDWIANQRQFEEEVRI